MRLDDDTYINISRGIMATVLDSDLKVTEFKLQSLYYIHFRINIFGKGMDPTYPPSYELNTNTDVFL